MLVISRKAGQTVQVGNDITIKLVRVAGGTVSIGIEAPNHIKIVRGELERDDAIEHASDTDPGRETGLCPHGGEG